MRKSSLALALAGLMLTAAPAFAANVTFAVQAPAGGQVAFSMVGTTGLIGKPKVVKATQTVDGVEYYTWTTSVNSKARIVCGVHSAPNAASKCVGSMAAPLRLDGNFVVLQ
jgi:hypothetical protein